MNAYLRLMRGLCVGRKRSASSCQRSALSYQLPFKLQSIFIKETSAVSDHQSALNRFTRSIGKLISKRKPSAVSSQLSDMARHIRAISKLKLKTYQLSAIGSQPSDMARYVRATSRLKPNAYHLIPLLILVFVSCGAVLAQEPVGHTAPAAQAETEQLDLKIPDGGLRIGDKIPDITISNISNYESSSAKISDFKGKLLILDFWATWCSPCVIMIPKMDSLQKEFGDKIQFLSVTYQKPEVVLPFLEKMERQQEEKYQLPLAVSDNILRILFPHKQLPHYVWIDPQGVVQAITGMEEINSQTIASVLNGDMVNLIVKKDVVEKYNRDEPLIVGNHHLDPKPILYQSTIADYIEGLPSGFQIFKNENSKIERVVATNSLLHHLASYIFSDNGRFFSDNLILLKVKDTTKFNSNLVGEEWGKWLAANSYNYELIVPQNLASQTSRIMQEDLRRYFYDYNFNIIKSKNKCLSLVRISNNDKIATKGGEPSLIFDGLSCELKNRNLEGFVTMLNIQHLQHSPYPVVDHTGYLGNVDMVLEGNLSDLNALRKALVIYDLDIVEAEEEIDMLVISDKEVGS